MLERSHCLDCDQYPLLAVVNTQSSESCQAVEVCFVRCFFSLTTRQSGASSACTVWNRVLRHLQELNALFFFGRLCGRTSPRERRRKPPWYLRGWYGGLMMWTLHIKRWSYRRRNSLKCPPDLRHTKDEDPTFQVAQLYWNPDFDISRSAAR